MCRPIKYRIIYAILRENSEKIKRKRLLNQPILWLRERQYPRPPRSTFCLRIRAADDEADADPTWIRQVQPVEQAPGVSTNIVEARLRHIIHHRTDPLRRYRLAGEHRGAIWILRLRCAIGCTRPGWMDTAVTSGRWRCAPVPEACRAYHFPSTTFSRLLMMTVVQRSKFVTKNEVKSSTPIFAYFARQFREARLMESS